MLTTIFFCSAYLYRTSAGFIHLGFSLLEARTSAHRRLFFNVMRSINLRFTYFLAYLLRPSPTGTSTNFVRSTSYLLITSATCDVTGKHGGKHKWTYRTVRSLRQQDILVASHQRTQLSARKLRNAGETPTRNYYQFIHERKTKNIFKSSVKYLNGDDMLYNRRVN